MTTDVHESRRRRPSSEVRRLLIEEASRQFAERGYAATTMKDLTSATEVAISVLYHHFPSKADLLREAVLRPFVDLVDSVGATWTSLQDQPWEEEQLVRKFVEEVYGSLLGHRGALRTLVAARPELDERTRSEIDRALRRMFLELRALVEESRAHGWRPSERIEIHIRLLITLLAGCALMEDLFLPDKVIGSRDELFDDITDFVRLGMSVRQRSAAAGAESRRSHGERG